MAQQSNPGQGNWCHRLFQRHSDKKKTLGSAAHIDAPFDALCSRGASDKIDPAKPETCGGKTTERNKVNKRVVEPHIREFFTELGHIPSPLRILAAATGASKSNSNNNSERPKLLE